MLEVLNVFSLILLFAVAVLYVQGCNRLQGTCS